MERSYIMPRLCFILMLALSLISVALRSLCMVFYFDADPGYFAADFMPILSNALYFVAVATAAICVCLIPANSLPKELRTYMRAPLSIVLGLALVVFTALSFALCFSARKSNLMIAPAALGILASLYYFISANRNGRYPDWLSLCGYLSVFWSVAGIGEVYFDRYTAMNSPVKISLLFALMGFMFIVLAEMRFRVDRSMPRYSVFLLSVGCFTTLTGSIPLLVAIGAGKLDSIRLLLYSAVLIVAGFYGFYLLLHYTMCSTEETDEEATDKTPEEDADETTSIEETAAPNAE